MDTENKVKAGRRERGKKGKRRGGRKRKKSMNEGRKKREGEQSDLLGYFIFMRTSAMVKKTGFDQTQKDK